MVNTDKELLSIFELQKNEIQTDFEMFKILIKDKIKNFLKVFPNSNIDPRMLALDTFTELGLHNISETSIFDSETLLLDLYKLCQSTYGKVFHICDWYGDYNLVNSFEMFKENENIRDIGNKELVDYVFEPDNVYDIVSYRDLIRRLDNLKECNLTKLSVLELINIKEAENTYKALKLEKSIIEIKELILEAFDKENITHFKRKVIYTND